MSRSVAEIDLGAIAHNVAELRHCVGPGPKLCAVVKAGGYGHGAVEVARAALDAGAAWLAVAQGTEGAELRRAGIDAPILLLSEPIDAEEIAQVVANELRVAVYQASTIEALAATGARLALHLKVDTGMRRVGASPDELIGLARRIEAAPQLALEGVWTHCAVADEPDNAFTGTQLARFVDATERLAGAGIEIPMRHAANSATCMTRPEGCFDLVRPGIALYGVDPAPALRGRLDLRPALRWSSRISLVKRVAAGEGVSYGHHHRLAAASVVATVPVGYADGLVRRWSLRGGTALIGGRRRPLIGAVTMDQVLVDCGPEGDVEVGDEVVFIGRQGDEVIGVEELGAATDTIGYEILTRIGPRVARRYR